MDRDWQEVRAKLAELVALAGETRDRTLSEEEAARLYAAVDLLDEVKRELRKKRPSMKRIRRRIYETVMRFERNEAAQDAP